MHGHYAGGKNTGSIWVESVASQRGAPEGTGSSSRNNRKIGILLRHQNWGSESFGAYANR